MKSIKQFFCEYTKWEDFINGMYEIPEKKDVEEYVNSSISLLSNPDFFYKISNNVLNQWPISTKVNLTNTGCNRRAWLGQASCCLLYKSPEICTRIAWSKLSVFQQNNANNVADIVIKIFEKKYEKENTKIYKGMGEQMLFEWNS